MICFPPPLKFPLKTTGAWADLYSAAASQLNNVEKGVKSAASCAVCSLPLPPAKQHNTGTAKVNAASRLLTWEEVHQLQLICTLITLQAVLTGPYCLHISLWAAYHVAALAASSYKVAYPVGKVG